MVAVHPLLTVQESDTTHTHTMYTLNTSISNVLPALELGAVVVLVTVAVAVLELKCPQKYSQEYPLKYVHIYSCTYIYLSHTHHILVVS